MIQNTAESKKDFMKTLYKKYLSLKTISDKIRMGLENNIKKKEKNNMNRTMNRRKIKTFYKLLLSYFYSC